ncbi:MAG: hypothetical protein IJR49_02665 [Treponema sp.]|nr:hypothetical protein [Treponema sp.]
MRVTEARKGGLRKIFAPKKALEKKSLNLSYIRGICSSRTNQTHESKKNLS